VSSIGSGSPLQIAAVSSSLLELCPKTAIGNDRAWRCASARPFLNERATGLVPFRGRRDIEVLWINRERRRRASIVFRCTRVGQSVGVARVSPPAVFDSGGFRGLVYSRPGFNGRASAQGLPTTA